MSSTRSVIVSRQIYTAGSMTGTSTIVSQEVDIIGLDTVSIETTWTGTPNGTFTIQAAAQVNQFGAGVNFLPIVGTSTFTATGSAASNLQNLTGLGYAKLRLSYTNTSGTGTVNAWLTGKGL